jgi:tetratricopeptide (TPR) repeat protein
MRTQLIGLMLGSLVLAPGLEGQGHWLAPRCELKSGHSLVNSGMLHLKNAAETRFDDVRERDLNDASRSLVQAVTTAGQEKNPAAWYYLARYYVARKDLVGADSAFRRAEGLQPACKDDIQFWRRNILWVPELNAGVAALNAQDYDSAIAAFRRAAVIYDAEPHGFTTLATAFFNMPAEIYLPDSTFQRMYPNLPDSLVGPTRDSVARTRYDSAAKYFRRGVEAAADPRFAKERADALFNLGNAFYAGVHYDSAAAAYSTYIKDVPTDALALARLADVLAASGHQDSAMAVYATIIAHPDSMDPVSLFNAGVSIYNAAPARPDTERLSGDCRRQRTSGRPTPAQRRAIVAACDSVARQAIQARDTAAAVNYRMAVRAFEAGLARNSHSRDGLYNLATSYFALHQSDQMLPVAQRLTAVDPMNRNALRLLAQAWQLNGRSDSALFYVTLADSLLPVEISVGNFSLGDSSVTLGGLASNFHETASAPVSLVFEFLDAKGGVVTSQRQEIPAVPAAGNSPFTIQATGTGIVAWRYRRS